MSKRFSEAQRRLFSKQKSWTGMIAFPNLQELGEFMHGMVAFEVEPDCQLSLEWQATIGPNFASVSPPTVAGGVVYYGDGPGRQLLAFHAVTGRRLWSSGSTIRGAIFGAPMVVNGRVFVGAWDGKLYAFGL